MSYTPTTWAAGDTVTAAKLNKLEQGVANGGGVLVVTVGEGNVCDKSYNDIISAIQSNLVVALKEPDSDGFENMFSYLSSTSVGEGGYFAYFAGGSVGIAASSADANMTYIE